MKEDPVELLKNAIKQIKQLLPIAPEGLYKERLAESMEWAEMLLPVLDTIDLTAENGDDFYEAIQNIQNIYNKHAAN